MNDNIGLETEIENPVELHTYSNIHNDDSLQFTELNSKALSTNEQNVEYEEKVGPLQLSIGIDENNDQMLTINNIDRRNKEIYEFCVKNSLDFVAMEAIQSQVNGWVKENLTISQQQRNTMELSNYSSENGNKKTYKKRKGNQIDKKNSYSISCSEKSQNHSLSQRNLHTLFPYQIGITSCHIQKVKNTHKTIRNKPSYGKNHYSKSISYVKTSQERCYTCPTDNKNTISDNNNNNNENQSMTLSHTKYNSQSKIINELLHSPIVKSDNNNFYLRNENNTSKDYQTLSFKETINDKSMKYDKKVNYGQIIYERNMQKKDECDQKVLQIRDKLNKSQNYTFHPSINTISKKAEEYRVTKAIEYNNPKTILQYKTYSQEKHKILKDKYESIDNEEYVSLCTFTPAINHNYPLKKKDTNDSNFEKHYEKLYNDQMIKDRNLQQLSQAVYQMHSYQPITNKQAKIQMKFDARLVDYQRKLSEKNEKRKQEWIHGQNHDPITNKPLFYPQFESKSTKEDKKYYYDFNLEESHKKRQHQYYPKESKISCLNSTSGEMFESRKIGSLKRIFKILDSDDDGIISSITMNYKGLNKNVKEILQPLFDEMKEGSDTLKEQDFIEICNKLYQILPYDKRKQLLEINTINKRNHNAIHPPHNHPIIDGNSFSYRISASHNKMASKNKKIQEILNTTLGGNDYNKDNAYRCSTTIGNTSEFRTSKKSKGQYDFAVLSPILHRERKILYDLIVPPNRLSLNNHHTHGSEKIKKEITSLNKDFTSEGVTTGGFRNRPVINTNRKELDFSVKTVYSYSSVKKSLIVSDSIRKKRKNMSIHQTKTPKIGIVFNQKGNNEFEVFMREMTNAKKKLLTERTFLEIK